MASVQASIVEIVARKLRRRPSDIDTSASIVHDLGADSLDSLEIVMELEDKFGLRIDDERAERMRTVQDAYEYVNAVLEERSLASSRKAIKFAR